MIKLELWRDIWLQLGLLHHFLWVCLSCVFVPKGALFGTSRINLCLHCNSVWLKGEGLKSQDKDRA